MVEGSDGVLDLLKYFWSALLLPLIAVIWTLVTGRITKLETEMPNKMSTAVWDRRKAERDLQYNALRVEIKELYGRDDKIKDFVNDKIDQLRRDMRSDITLVIDEIKKSR